MPAAIQLRHRSRFAFRKILTLALVTCCSATGCLTIGGRTVYENEETSQRVQALERRISQLEQSQPGVYQASANEVSAPPATRPR